MFVISFPLLSVVAFVNDLADTFPLRFAVGRLRAVERRPQRHRAAFETARARALDENVAVFHQINKFDFAVRVRAVIFADRLFGRIDLFAVDFGDRARKPFFGGNV